MYTPSDLIMAITLRPPAAPQAVILSGNKHVDEDKMQDTYLKIIRKEDTEHWVLPL